MRVLSEQERVRRETLARLCEQGYAYPNGFRPKDLSHDLHRDFDSVSKVDLEAREVQASLAGRVIAIRDFGKAAFISIRDRSGDMQFFVKKERVGDEGFEVYRQLDVGDFIYGEGRLFKTKTDALALELLQLALVTKSLRPLGEKFHGVVDIETRYRDRSLDLIMNAEARDVFKLRAVIVQEIRQFFLERDFLEVETPMMHAIAGGAAAKPFCTHHEALDMELFLRIAPELYLKRLVVGGFERVFEINRNFRNEGISIKHNPEFTMLEFYQAYATFEDCIEMTKELFCRLAMKVHGTLQFAYQGQLIDFQAWRVVRMEDAVREMSAYTESLRDPAALASYCKMHGMDVRHATAGSLLMYIFETEVEHKLIAPTFVTHYPRDISPLSRANDQDPFVVDRFELYIGGREISNAFSELNDPLDQRQRFEEQMARKVRGDQEACALDEDYLLALELGMPPTAGQGIGIDRLVMLLTDASSIRDVILFPLMRLTSRC